MRVSADDVICGVSGLAAPELMPGRRVAAGRHLEQVVVRARRYNADPGRLLTIVRITALGNCLDPDGCRSGNLELAVSAMRRESDRDLYVRKVLAYARASGRRFGAFHELIYWPDRELRLILKNHSPVISITDEATRSRTCRLELVYAVSEDPDAITPAPNSKSQRLAAALSLVSPT
jgi:hypothetical protein